MQIVDHRPAARRHCLADQGARRERHQKGARRTGFPRQAVRGDRLVPAVGGPGAAQGETGAADDGSGFFLIDLITHRVSLH